MQCVVPQSTRLRALPINSGCTARALGQQRTFPVGNHVKKYPEKTLARHRHPRPGEVLLQKRPESGIWGGLWAPPEFDEAEGATEWITDTLSLPPDVCQVDAAFHHTFTHFKLEAHSVRAHLGTNRALGNRVECAAGSLKWFVCTRRRRWVCPHRSCGCWPD
ncbi:MAG: hypothetical protein CM15mP74_14700 [Halieaceae bacterium]|nr:MAG: hypothetical protein CM15mP74_14700 [Halieaceae bacterium]